LRAGTVRLEEPSHFFLGQNMKSSANSWRIVALVSTARLLTPWIGLNDAAMTSASSARQFQMKFITAFSSLDRQIIEGACAAVNQDNVETMAAVSASIAVRLNTASSADCAAEDLRELHADS
jgi:hypothetical protein